MLRTWACLTCLIFTLVFDEEYLRSSRSELLLLNLSNLFNIIGLFDQDVDNCLLFTLPKEKNSYKNMQLGCKAIKTVVETKFSRRQHL